MYQSIPHLSNLDPNYDYYLFTPRRTTSRRRIVPTSPATDPALSELRDQLEENNRLLRSLNQRSGQNSGVNTPQGSQRSGYNNNSRGHPDSRGGGQLGSRGGQLVKVPRLPIPEIPSSPEIMTSVFNGQFMEPLLMQTQRDMQRKYDELEEKYRKLEDKVSSQKQQIKSMQSQKHYQHEQTEKQNQLRDVQKQLEQIKHDIKLRERLATTLPKVTIPPHPHPPHYPTFHSKYYPSYEPSNPYGHGGYNHKDLLLHQEVDLLHKELNALDAMKYHLH